DEDGVHAGAGTLTLTVANAAPSISLSGPGSVEEGATFIGWGTFADPGADTWTATVDYGDGTGLQPLVLRSDKSFDLSHTYAHSGTYTITVTVHDDDGASDMETLPIHVVSHVAPTLTVVDDQATQEGARLALTDIGVFSDPWGDTSDDSLETFTYSVDWGDGTPIDSGDATVDQVGSQGHPSIGSFDGSHVYADDGLYTVTVTVFDDSGHSDTGTFTVVVSNVAPTILTFNDNEMNSLGQVFVQGTFGDPGTDNPQNPLTPPDGSRESFQVVIDWSDGTRDTILVAGPGPFHFEASHTYSGPLDPLNPAADVPILVTVSDDDGDWVVATTYAEVPGEEVKNVYIDTTPDVPHLIFPRAARWDADGPGNRTAEFVLASSDHDSVRPDDFAASENYLVLRIVMPDGSEGSEYRLPDNALNILPEILGRLPDNRYRVYEIQGDGPERLVREVSVRQHRVIDQTDASEGIEEHAPQSQPVLPEQPGPESDDRPGRLGHQPERATAGTEVACSRSGTEDAALSAWEQWDGGVPAAPATGEAVGDSGQSPGAGGVEQDEPAAAAASASPAASPPLLGAALLACRLRWYRERAAERTRERFAQWGGATSDGRQRYPRKPR
ncbi:MAG: PKD domain-containing protein, partial [Thermoguttaceae bacterium]